MAEKEAAHEITEILVEWSHGDPRAMERLFPIVYEELRQQAKHYLRRERVNHTLQPTALVHEAYMRLAGARGTAIENRIHFFGIASRIMRQILVDHARQHNAEKRGGAAHRFSIQTLDILPDQSAGDMLELNEALQRLEQIDQRKCKVVEMRFFGGLSEHEIAEFLGVSEKTVRRDWKFAKLWLFRELSGIPPEI